VTWYSWKTTVTSSLVLREACVSRYTVLGLVLTIFCLNCLLGCLGWNLTMP
jgi:hypothetical protein